MLCRDRYSEYEPNKAKRVKSAHARDRRVLRNFLPVCATPPARSTPQWLSWLFVAAAHYIHANITSQVRNSCCMNIAYLPIERRCVAPTIVPVAKCRWHELHAATHRPSGDARICRCADASWTSNAVLNAGECCTAGRVKERIVPRYDARPASQCVEPTAADAVRECGGEWLLIDGRSLHSIPREVVLDAEVAGPPTAMKGPRHFAPVNVPGSHLVGPHPAELSRATCRLQG